MHDQYNDRRLQSRHAGGGRQLTKQADKDRCDIRKIMSKYARTGILPRTSRTARYGDFSTVGDFLDATLRVQEAHEQFLELPSDVRGACENDPAKFLEALEDPEKLEELKKLGLDDGQVPDDGASGPAAATSPPAAAGEQPSPSKTEPKATSGVPAESDSGND